MARSGPRPGTPASRLSNEELRELYPVVLRAARAVVGPDAAEDIAQETFIRLLRSDEAKSTKGWMYRVARNLAIDEVRRRRFLRDFGADDDAEAPAPDPAEILAVRHAMRSLPDHYRLVLWMKDVEGRTAKEIASVLGVSPGSVELRLFRARKALRAAYEGPSRRALSVVLLPAMLAAALVRRALQAATLPGLAKVAAAGVIAAGMAAPLVVPSSTPREATAGPSSWPGVVAPALPAGSRQSPATIAEQGNSAATPSGAADTAHAPRPAIVGVLDGLGDLVPEKAADLLDLEPWILVARVARKSDVLRDDVSLHLDAREWVTDARDESLKRFQVQIPRDLARRTPVGADLLVLLDRADAGAQPAVLRLLRISGNDRLTALDGAPFAHSFSQVRDRAAGFGRRR